MMIGLEENVRNDDVNGNKMNLRSDDDRGGGGGGKGDMRKEKCVIHAMPRALRCQVRSGHVHNICQCTMGKFIINSLLTVIIPVNNFLIPY